jgi:hypothetical protein
LTHGCVSWYRGDWRQAWERCRSAAAIYRDECRGSEWELALSQVFGFSALTYLGDFEELQRRVPDALQSARDREDRYAAVNLAFYESAVRLWRGEADEAIRIAEDAIRPFPRTTILSIHYGIDYAIAQGELYRGHADRAWTILDRGWPEWRRAGLTQAQCARVEIDYLRTRIALAVLSSRPDRATTRDAVRVFEHAVRRLNRDRLAPASALTKAAQAGRHALAGDVERADSLLSEAAVRFDECDMALHAVAARHHRDVLAGRPAAATPATDRRPPGADERFYHTLIPGFAR